MAYGFEEIRKCHQLDKDIMMEVMVGDRDRFRDSTRRAFPGQDHRLCRAYPPTDKGLLEMIHAKGACTMAARREISTANSGLAVPRRHRHRKGLPRTPGSGVDLIEADLPSRSDTSVRSPVMPASKSQYFQLPNR